MFKEPYVVNSAEVMLVQFGFSVWRNLKSIYLKEVLMFEYWFYKVVGVVAYYLCNAVAVL